VLFSDRDKSWKLAEYSHDLTCDGTKNLSNEGGKDHCYSAPEVFRRAAIPDPRQSDIWATGCIFYELIVGRKVFTSSWDAYYYVRGKQPLVVPLAFCAAESRAASLIEAMLKPEACERPTVAAILEKLSDVTFFTRPVAEGEASGGNLGQTKSDNDTSTFVSEPLTVLLSNEESLKSDTQEENIGTLSERIAESGNPTALAIADSLNTSVQDIPKSPTCTVEDSATGGHPLQVVEIGGDDIVEGQKRSNGINVSQAPIGGDKLSAIGDDMPMARPKLLARFLKALSPAKRRRA
jgi:serine/threonine protein kinase